METIRIGTRKSQLAMWQTENVAALLHQKGVVTEISSMETKGDKILDTSIAKIGSKGVFTEELEQQLSAGVTDIAVHSAKDLQSQLPEGYEVIAFTARETVNDVLVSDEDDFDIADTSRTVRIGTSSVRRVAFLRHYYPHVETVEMRGNLQTRISKMQSGACDALMLAYAGVKRMGYLNMIVSVFPETEFVPPVGQGCIAIEAASTLSVEKRQMIRSCVNNLKAEICLTAERAFLGTLEGGCSIPAFALATLEGEEGLKICGGLASLDGSCIIRKTVKGAVSEAAAIGELLARNILDEGGRDLLLQIRSEQSR